MCAAYSWYAARVTLRIASRSSGRASRTRRSVTGTRAGARGEKIDVGALDELVLGEAERRHQAARLLDARARAFALGQDHLELEKVAQALDAVQVHARPAHEVQGAVLAHAPGCAVRHRQHLAQRIGRARRR